MAVEAPEINFQQTETPVEQAPPLYQIENDQEEYTNWPDNVQNEKLLFPPNENSPPWDELKDLKHNLSFFKIDNWSGKDKTINMGPINSRAFAMGKKMHIFQVQPLFLIIVLHYLYFRFNH